MLAIKVKNKTKNAFQHYTIIIIMTTLVTRMLIKVTMTALSDKMEPKNFHSGKECRAHDRSGECEGLLIQMNTLWFLRT